MKQLTILAAIVVALALFQGAEAKRFTECQLAKLLYRTYGFDRTKTNNFVCMAMAESSLDTSRTHVNSDRSTDYGLFQINNNFWCSTPGFRGRGNDCNVACSELLKDDISKAVTCANKIFGRHGYQAWYGWRAKCKSGVKDLSNCM